jgi:hypothetical protein
VPVGTGLSSFLGHQGKGQGFRTGSIRGQGFRTAPYVAPCRALRGAGAWWCQNDPATRYGASSDLSRHRAWWGQLESPGQSVRGQG